MNRPRFLMIALVTSCLVTSVVAAQETPKAADPSAAVTPATLDGNYVSAPPESGSVGLPGVITIQGDQWTATIPQPAGRPPVTINLKLTIDSTKEPKAIDRLASTGTSSIGIYKWVGDKLTLCFAPTGVKDRPTDFAAVDGRRLYQLSRLGPPGAPSAAELAKAYTPSNTAPPDFMAYRAASRITDPEQKLAALQKFLIDFPASSQARYAQSAIIEILLKNHRDKPEELRAALDKQIAAAHESAKRYALNGAAWALFEADLMLEEALDYSKKSLALFDEQKFIAEQQQIAKDSKLPVPPEATLKTEYRQDLSMVQDTVGQLYLKLGKEAEGENLLRKALEADPLQAYTAFTLASLVEKRGEDEAAFDLLKVAALGTGSVPKDKVQEKLNALYTKLHGSRAGAPSLESLLDDHHRKLFPPLHVAAYQPSATRSDRVVLAEVFTGSGCPPCVGVDVAFDALMERYNTKDLIVLMYHLPIPLPDPMANRSTLARSNYYAVRGVPAAMIDGTFMGAGGSRAMAQSFFDRFNPTVERRLEVPAEASLKLTSALEGTTVKVAADVSQIKGEPNELRLHIALVEGMLSYAGENGIRLHPVVVRSLAGKDAEGFALEAAKPNSIKHTFDLAAISADLKAYLDETEAESPSGRKFSQMKDAINAQNLSVVAFVQDQISKKILQAAHLGLKGR